MELIKRHTSQGTIRDGRILTGRPDSPLQPWVRKADSFFFFHFRKEGNTKHSLWVDTYVQ